MKLDIKVGPFGAVTQAQVKTDWFSIIQRQQKKVDAAKERRSAAEFAHQQAEAELERLKRQARAAGAL